jgi:hypothetical protein
MSLPQISVAIALYGDGDFHAIKVLPVVCRAWLKQDAPCEVVIAVTDGTPVPALPHHDLIRVVPAPRDMASPGPLRNLAASHARAPVLYLSDADVAPVGTDFARQALAMLDGPPVVQPWQYRLINPEAAPEPPYERLGQGRACHVIIDAAGKLTPVTSERFRWLGPDMLVAEPPPGVASAPDGTDWQPFPFQWGGMILRRETFDQVGGYSARYIGWGCDDDDLIVKLEGTTGIVRAWRAAPQKLSCLHFEHPRSHTIATHGPNKVILAERLAAGVAAMIEEDRR